MQLRGVPADERCGKMLRHGCGRLLVRAVVARMLRLKEPAEAQQLHEPAAVASSRDGHAPEGASSRGKAGGQSVGERAEALLWTLAGVEGDGLWRRMVSLAWERAAALPLPSPLIAYVLDLEVKSPPEAPPHRARAR